MNKITALIQELRLLLRNSKNYIIVAQLAVIGIMLLIGYYIFRGKDATIKFERERNLTLEKAVNMKDNIIDEKNKMILTVLIGINVRANALFDSAEAQNHRK